MEKLSFGIGKLKRIEAIYSKFVELWHFTPFSGDLSHVLFWAETYPF